MSSGPTTARADHLARAFFDLRTRETGNRFRLILRDYDMFVGQRLLPVDELPANRPGSSYFKLKMLIFEHSISAL